MATLEKIALHAVASSDGYWRLQRRSLQGLPEDLANRLLAALLVGRRLDRPPHLELFAPRVSQASLDGSCLPGPPRPWLAALAAFPCLASLRLVGWRLGDGELALLAPLAPRLRSLALRRCRLATSGGGLAALTGLESLELTGMRLQLTLGDWLSGMVRLRSLSLEGLPGVDAEAAGRLARLPLRALRLTGVGLQCAELPALPQLTSLHLAGCGSPSGLQPPRLPSDHLPCLRELTLRGMASDLEAVAGLGGLQSLDLADSPVTALQLGSLMGMGRLERLSLACCPGVTDGVWEVAAQLTSLTSLDLSDCPSLTPGRRDAPGPAAAPVLASLAALDVSGSAFDDEGCRRLVSSCPSLAQLNAAAPGVTGAGVEALTALAALTQLTVIGWEAGEEGGLVATPGAATLRQLCVHRGGGVRFGNIAAGWRGGGLGAAAGAGGGAPSHGIPQSNSSPGWLGAASKTSPQATPRQQRPPLPAGAAAYDERVRWTREELLGLAAGAGTRGLLAGVVPEDLLLEPARPSSPAR